MSPAQISTYDPKAGYGHGAVNAKSISAENMKTPPDFSLTKGDIENIPLESSLVQKLISLGFYRESDAATARAWLQSIRNRTRLHLQWELPHVPILMEGDKVELARRWDALNLAYDPATGIAQPAFAESLAAENLPTNLWNEAYHRAQSGRYPNFEAALQSVCDEFRTPMPRIARVFQDLLAKEPELLAQETEALARLNEARNKIADARASAVGVLNTRERLASRVTELHAETKEIEMKKQVLESRRTRHFKDATRTLRPGALLNPHFAVDQGAAVAGFDILLGELARMLEAKQGELTAAEKEQADFLAANAKDLEPVTRN